MFHLAQLNIARMKMAYEDPRMRFFIERLDPVNAGADQSPGFVWRMVSDENPDQALIEFEATGWLVNMSVWTDLQSLRSFVMRPEHLEVMKRRGEWFERWPQATMVLWWVDAGYIPDFGEAWSRLLELRANGPSRGAFNFSHPFPPPGPEASNE